MIGILNNNLSVLVSLLERLKSYISYFGYASGPDSPSRGRYCGKSSSSNKTPKKNNKEEKKETISKEIDKKECLSLDNINVLTIIKDNQEKYRVTMMGLEEDNYEERVLLTKKKTERDVIEKCIQKNWDLERKNIKQYIPEEGQRLYMVALNNEEYECCLEVLKLLEKHLNKTSKKQKTNKEQKIKKLK